MSQAIPARVQTSPQSGVVAGQHHTHYRAIFSLISVVFILASFGPAAKFVLTHSDITPFELAGSRVLIGFLFLCMTVCICDRPSLVRLSPRDVGLLSGLGLLCVGVPYALSAWGLQYTTVTNYVLIYSLVPSFTALFSYLMGKERLTATKLSGIVLSLFGCVVAVTHGFSKVSHMPLGLGFGEVLIALFALMMSASIVASAGIVMRFGAMTANTVMFGSSFIFLFIGILLHEPPPREPITMFTGFALLYIGVTTASVFLLRFFALRSLSPSTVGAFHNLVPILTIGLAVVFLNEPLAGHTIIGAVAILAGVELVRRNTWVRKPRFPNPQQAPGRAGRTAIQGWGQEKITSLRRIVRL